MIGKASDASISGMAGISLEAAKWNEYQNIRELRDKIERLKTSGALNRLRDNEYVVFMQNTMEQQSESSETKKEMQLM